MNPLAIFLSITLLVGAGSAEARGCVEGAVVGGVAGHFAHHHALLGAAAGCVVGHHLAHKRELERKRAALAAQRANPR